MAMIMRMDFKPIDTKVDIRERVMRLMAKDMGISVEQVEAKFHEIEPSVGYRFGEAMMRLHAWHGRVMTGQETL